MSPWWWGAELRRVLPYIDAVEMYTVPDADRRAALRGQLGAGAYTRSLKS